MAFRTAVPAKVKMSSPHIVNSTESSISNIFSASQNCKAEICFPPLCQVESQRGESQRGESQRGEPQRGESQRGEPQRGESQRGEPQSGESQRGEPQRGESQRGAPQRGESQRGECDLFILLYKKKLMGAGG